MPGLQTMQAVRIHGFGPASVLALEQVPVPAPGPGQVLVRVHAASVNPIDWKIRDGLMSARYGTAFPLVLGFDAAGEVAGLGPGVHGFALGEPVFARSDIGPGQCYAEYALLNAATVARKPQRMSFEEAAGVPLAGLTALVGLRDVAGLAAGQRVLVIGASGGVGTYAVQIAKNLGAHVTGVCSQPNVALVRGLGADAVLDYRREPVLRKGAGYDVIYDTVGAHEHAAAVPALTPAGVYLTLVPTPGVEFFVPGQTERRARGGYFVVWSPKGADLELLGRWADSGRLRTVVDGVYPLAEIRAAHERSQTLRARGKIIIRVFHSGRGARKGE